MPTHTIGRGKVNVATTFDVDDAQLLGRVAYMTGKSRNEFVREVVLEAVRRAQSAQRLAVKVGKGALFILSLTALLYAAFHGADMRRTARTIRPARRRWEELV